MEEIKIF